MKQHIKITKTFTFILRFNQMESSNNQCPGHIGSAEFKTLRPFPFFTPGGMEKNLESYDLTMPNKYIQCDYALSREGDLRTHLNSGEKSNKCSLCDYASSYASALRKHMKRHNREKSNKCNQCKYASSDVGNFKRHLRTHSGEKSNKCNQCDFASFQAGNLRSHLKTHSGNSV